MEKSLIAYKIYDLSNAGIICNQAGIYLNISKNILLLVVPFGVKVT